MSFTLSVHFFIGFRNVFFARTFNRKKRLRDEREKCLHCKEKEMAVGEKKYTSLADHRSARFASRYFFLRTVEPGPRLMLVRNLFLSFYLLRAVFKIQSVVRFTQYVVASPCFIPSPQSVIYTHQSYSNPNSKF